MNTAQNPELSTTAHKHNLPITDNTVVDQNRSDDISGRVADATLVVIVESPRVDAALLGDGEVGIHAGVSSNNGGKLQTGGSLQDARLLALHTKDAVVSVVVVLGEAELVTVDAAKRKDLAVVRDGEGVVLAANDVDDLVVGELLDERGLQDDRPVVANILVLDAELAVVVETPGPDLALVVEGEGVVGAGGNLGDLDAALEGHAAGAEAGGLHVALDTAAGELVLLGRTPGLDFALVVKGQDVVGAGGDGDDLLWLIEKDRVLLNFNVLGES